MKGEIKKLANKLGNEQGVVLRYIVSTPKQPVVPTRLTTKIEWSYLPKTYLEAKHVFDQLVKRQLIKKKGKGYTYTQKGSEVIEHANKNKLWREPRGEAPVSSRRNF
jgi:predicted transcriptional regulator